MKKTLSLILINIFLIVFFFLFIDFLIYIKIYIKFRIYAHDLSYKGYKENVIKYKNRMMEDKLYRPVENPDSDKTIIIFGDSFAYGNDLKDNETFSHQLGKLTGYRVYNRSQKDRSVQHMLYQLENEDFIKSMPKPDYIIYVFIPPQIRRTWLSGIGFHRDFYYKKKNDKLVIDSPSVEKYITGLFETNLNSFYTTHFFFNYQKWETDLFFDHITQSLDDIKKNWGDDVKFIFFGYEDFFDDEYYLEKLKNLEQDGVICVNLSDLSDEHYISNVKYRTNEYEYNPNSRAWAEITPLFVNYLQNLNYMK